VLRLARSGFTPRGAGPAGTADEFADLALTGLELVPPGLVPVSEWRPDTEPGLRPQPAEVAYYGVIAAKPVTAGRRYPAQRG